MAAVYSEPGEEQLPAAFLASAPSTGNGPRLGLEGGVGRTRASVGVQHPALDPQLDRASFSAATAAMAQPSASLLGAGISLHF